MRDHSTQCDAQCDQNIADAQNGMMILCIGEHHIQSGGRAEDKRVKPVGWLRAARWFIRHHNDQKILRIPVPEDELISRRADCGVDNDDERRVCATQITIPMPSLSILDRRKELAST
jgi:hypothetical protein